MEVQEDQVDMEVMVEVEEMVAILLYITLHKCVIT